MNNGSNAGSFYWNVNNASSNRNRNISSHLLNANKNQEAPWVIQGASSHVNNIALPLGKT